ncbi:hypothetical protein NKH77_35405 [Streptomyces sp. M19]
MHHSQWKDREAYATFVRTHRQERVDDIDAAVPGIVRQGWPGPGGTGARRRDTAAGGRPGAWC